jgi:hypothetical protein
MRTVVGSLLLIIWIALYTWVAMWIASLLLPGKSGLFQGVYYVVAGFAWVVPAMAIIWWMTKRFRR